MSVQVHGQQNSLTALVTAFSIAGLPPGPFYCQMHDIVSNYRDDASLRQKLFELIDSVYPWADFRTWYDLGFWSDAYVPYSVIEDDKIVANVSISMMDILLDGEPKKTAQIGTVGTLEDYRGRGYSKTLMDRVLSDYGNKTDFIFLYANDDVLDFYPRFGFEQKQESVFLSSKEFTSSERQARFLSVASEADRAIVQRLLKDSLPLTRRFGAISYQFVFFWHWINVFPNEVLYLDDDDIVFVTKESEECLRIFDVLSNKPLELSRYLSRILRSDSVNSIEYHFPPDVHRFEFKEIRPDDSLLFIRGHFPKDIGGFKLPTTAQT